MRASFSHRCLGTGRAGVAVLISAEHRQGPYRRRNIVVTSAADAQAPGGLLPDIMDYYLTFDADPSQHWLETDDNNNRSWVKFRLQRKGANASVTVLEEFGYPGNTSNK